MGVLVIVFVVVAVLVIVGVLVIVAVDVVDFVGVRELVIVALGLGVETIGVITEVGRSVFVGKKA